MDTWENLIRRRAYEIWHEAGRAGDAEEHWLQAVRELSGRLDAAPQPEAAARRKELQKDMTREPDATRRQPSRPRPFVQWMEETRRTLEALKEELKPAALASFSPLPATPTPDQKGHQACSSEKPPIGGPQEAQGAQDTLPPGRTTAAQASRPLRSVATTPAPRSPERTAGGRTPLVLLGPDDPLTNLRVLSSLQTFGYEALLAEDTPHALALLRSTSAFAALIVNADLPDSRGLALAKAARAINAQLAVIYTSRAPHRVPEREKVAGAPCLRIPYHPHQIVGLIGVLTGRGGSQEDAQVA